jgi:hypothetical protein
MAINKNHEFEDLDGVKCAVVERNVLPARVDFLRSILESNGYTLVVVPSPPPKAAPVAEGSPPPPPAPESFTVGVTDVTFNAVNAIFGRLLKTRGGKVVTLAYWNQEENVPSEDVPYFDRSGGAKQN